MQRNIKQTVSPQQGIFNPQTQTETRERKRRTFNIWRRRSPLSPIVSLDYTLLE